MISIYRLGVTQLLARTSLQLPVHTENWREHCVTCKHCTIRTWYFVPNGSSDEPNKTWLCSRPSCQIDGKLSSCSLARSSVGACGKDASLWQNEKE